MPLRQEPSHSCRKTVKGRKKRRRYAHVIEEMEVSQNCRVTASVDGACVGNPGPGGWAVVLEDANRGTSEWARSCPDSTTNNRMELAAALSAMEEGIARDVKPGDMVIQTDSQYVRKGITQWISRWKGNGWKTADHKAVRNQDLWVALDAAATRLRPRWKWVKAHCAATPSAHARADELARVAARAPTSNPSG